MAPISTADDQAFARLVSLACHDLRTPLATVHGFARTLTRMEDVGEPMTRYLGMIEAASRQLAELLDDLGVAARIEAGRYEPVTIGADTRELAEEAASGLDPGAVEVDGEGATVTVDREVVVRALRALARAALRHGGVTRVELRVRGRELTLAPVAESAAAVVLGESLRDLGSAVAVRVLEAHGGTAGRSGDGIRIVV